MVKTPQENVSKSLTKRVYEKKIVGNTGPKKTCKQMVKHMRSSLSIENVNDQEKSALQF